MEKAQLWMQIIWKYLVLILVIIGGIFVTIFVMKMMGKNSVPSIADKQKEIEDEIKNHKKTLEELDRYRDGRKPRK